MKLIAQENIKLLAAGAAKLIAGSEKLIAVGMRKIIVPPIPSGYKYVVSHDSYYIIDREGKFVYCLPLKTPALCTGGTVNDLTINGVLYRIHAFTATGGDELVVINPGLMDVFLIGGGGAGSGDSEGTNRGHGGGGAGGSILVANLYASSNILLSVGSGGIGGQSVGNGGEDTEFGALVALGGGGGTYQGTVGYDGGCGGGAGDQSLGNESWGKGIQPLSDSGGTGHRGGGSDSPGFDRRTGGGGGGIGQPGEHGYENDPGDGGAGQYFGSLFGDGYGVNGWFGGGGGGGTRGSGIGSGGIGGGGDGTAGYNDGHPGQANTGAGGGGAGNTRFASLSGGNGGSGIILVRYKL